MLNALTNSSKDGAGSRVTDAISPKSQIGLKRKLNAINRNVTINILWTYFYPKEGCGLIDSIVLYYYLHCTL